MNSPMVNQYQPLSPELLRKMHAYWRAANYLSVGQIYLFDNPLLKMPRLYSWTHLPAHQPREYPCARLRGRRHHHHRLRYDGTKWYGSFSFSHGRNWSLTANGRARCLSQTTVKRKTHNAAHRIALEHLLSLFVYVKGDYRDAATFDAIKHALGNAQYPAYYLAIPPALFARGGTFAQACDKQF